MEVLTRRETTYSSLLFHYCVKAVKKISMYDKIETPTPESLCELLAICTAIMSYREDERIRVGLLYSSSNIMARNLPSWSQEKVIEYILDKMELYHKVFLDTFQAGTSFYTADFSLLYRMIYHYPMRPVSYPYHEPKDRDAFGHTFMSMIEVLINGKSKAQRLCGMGEYKGVKWWKRFCLAQKMQ